MNHGRAAPAEAYGSGIAALGGFYVGRECAAQQVKILSCYPGRKLKCRTAYRLTVSAMADAHHGWVDDRFPGDVATQATTVNVQA